MIATRSELEHFKATFPMWKDRIVGWTPNKDGSIKVELSEKIFYVFTYSDDHTWRLETVRMYKKTA